MNQRFPLDTLPQPIRSYVTDGAKAIGCDPSFIAPPLLSALASAIGNSRTVMLKQSWREPAILWTVIVGTSGTMKSPAFELALKPMRVIHERLLREHANSLASWKIEHAQWMRSCKALPPDREPPPEPERPTCPRICTDDATIDSIAPLLAQNPRGLLLARDELSGWFDFGRFSKGLGTDGSSRWLEMFGGRMLSVDRKTSDPIFVSRASVSIAGGIQPEVFRRSIGQQHRDNGLAARFLFAWPPRRPKRWSEDDVSADLEASVISVFDRLHQIECGTDDLGNPVPLPLVLTTEAKERWVEFVNEHGEQQMELSGDAVAAWSKLEGYAARFALVLTLTRWAGESDSSRKPVGIDLSSVENAITLVRWFAGEAERVYAMIDESEDESELRRVREWIEGRGGTATARELSQGIRAYRSQTDQARAALERLIDRGEGYWVVDSARPGRPSDRMRLTQDVNVYETPSHALNNGGFVDVGTECS